MLAITHATAVVKTEHRLHFTYKKVEPDLLFAAFSQKNQYVVKDLRSLLCYNIIFHLANSTCVNWPCFSLSFLLVFHQLTTMLFFVVPLLCCWKTLVTESEKTLVVQETGNNVIPLRIEVAHRLSILLRSVNILLEAVIRLFYLYFLFVIKYQ